MLVTHARRFRLLRRGETWYFRRRIPHTFVSLLGRSEYTRSLHTPMYEEARRRAAVLDWRLERAFELARRARAVDTDRLIRRLCDQYLRRLVEQDREERRRSRRLDWEVISRRVVDCGYCADAVEDQMMAGDRSDVVEGARKLLAEAGQSLDNDTEAFDRLCYEMQRATIRACHISAAEWEGDFTGEPRSFDEASASEDLRHLMSDTPARNQKPAGRRLSEVIAAHVEDKQGKKCWTPKTGGMIKSELGRFLEIVGDKPIAEVTKEDIRGYRSTLEKLPARMATLYPGKSVGEVLAMGLKPGLSAASINKFMSHIHGLFDFAETVEWVERNPVVRALKIRTNRREAKHKRDVFTDEDLAAIFNRHYRAETLERGLSAKYWVPLLCLYTGARLEEMSQLLAEDVAEVDGIPAIRISFGEGQLLKNAGSERTVPIHPQLVDPLGFVRFVEEARQRGDRRLFPELTKHMNGYGDAVSKWFSRWLRGAAQIGDRRKVLHSFRHTIATRLSHAGVPVHTIAELLGHEYAKDATTTTRVYAKEDPNMLKKLAEAVEMLDFRKPLRALLS